MSTKHCVQAMEILLQSSGESLADRHQTLTEYTITLQTVVKLVLLLFYIILIVLLNILGIYFVISDTIFIYFERLVYFAVFQNIQFYTLNYIYVQILSLVQDCI